MMYKLFRFQLLIVILCFAEVWVNHRSKATGSCNIGLGLSSGGTLSDSSITSLVGDISTPSAGRLGNPDGAWCFSNDSIRLQTAVMTIDLKKEQFVSGFASQGPPEAIHPKIYNHLVAFSALFSLDGERWSEFNGGNLFFDTDKNDTIDVISYHVTSTAEFAKFIKINVTLQMSGAQEICLRFELYGCDTGVLPQSNIQALTTTKGQIEVAWKQPWVDITLEPESSAVGHLLPDNYVVLYRPVGTQTTSRTSTKDMQVSLEDVRLGATYNIDLQCYVKDAVIGCGSCTIEAYPPCPPDWTGGNEYHCFLYLDVVTSFEEARSACLERHTDEQLGKLGYLVDDEEKRFLVSRIIPKDVPDFWIVGAACESNEDCCKVYKLGDEASLTESECREKTPSSAVCMRDHKGEGSRLRISSASASEDGSAVSITWLYEGKGWKTDELQAQLWVDKELEDGEEEDTAMKILTFSTLQDTFLLRDLGPAIVYSLVLRPAPNIRTEEMTYNVVIIDFGETSAKFGCFLSPVHISAFIIWSGALKIAWTEAVALSSDGTERRASNYAISHQMAALQTSSEKTIINENEYKISPIVMETTYIFHLSSNFAGSYYSSGQISVTTDPPDRIIPQLSGGFVSYEVIKDIERNWKTAEEDCRERSGHLISVLDEKEAKVILKILPQKETKVWTGAKLGRKGANHWTDGHKITDLPMAKNSGVTSSNEACCRAFNEAGKLRMSGGNCSEEKPYICKSRFKEMISSPASMQVEVQNWNTIKMSWAKPAEFWVPTYYILRACPMPLEQGVCQFDDRQFKEESAVIQDLKELTEYDITVEAHLEPVSAKTTSNFAVMTYPKKHVKLTISPSGLMDVATPILISLRKKDAKVVVELKESPSLEVLQTTTGTVDKVSLSNLVPEQTYQLSLSIEGDDQWKKEVNFLAIPSCSSQDIQLKTNCLRVLEQPTDFASAGTTCQSEKSTSETLSLWKPEAVVQLSDVANQLSSFSHTSYWIAKPDDIPESESSEKENCLESTSKVECCFYDSPEQKFKCSSCCDEKKPVLCHYIVKADLGKLDLTVDSVGQTSIMIKWSPPTDVSWVISKFEIQWGKLEEKGEKSENLILVNSFNYFFSSLEIGTEYLISVRPLGLQDLRGEEISIVVETVDPRLPITVFVSENGTTTVSSPRLVGKGRADDDVILTMVESISKKKVSEVEGQAKSVLVSGLKPGMEYYAEMTTKEGKQLNYNATFIAFPSCREGQLQDGLACVWAPTESKTWQEAAMICKDENGELVDYDSKQMLSSSLRNLFTTHKNLSFWVATSKNREMAPQVEETSSCKEQTSSDVRCCSYKVLDGKILDDLQCTCCDEQKPFACKSSNKIDLGDIGDLKVGDVTSTSVTMTWKLLTTSSWHSPSFLVTWRPVSEKEPRKRAADDHMVVDQSEVKVEGLKSKTTYKLSVSPYHDGTDVKKQPKEITATTSDDLTIAGAQFQGSTCTIIILKISCCVSVLLGSMFTIFVFIVSRMFYLDCLAQFCSEIGLIGAYLCILISSAQSYSIDDHCVRARPTLCTIVAVLIQFFFMVIFLFMLLEGILIAQLLKDNVPTGFATKSPWSLFLCGFGIPGVTSIISVAVAGDSFTDDSDNCWLNLSGNAMYSSVIPPAVFSALSFVLMLMVIHADDPKKSLSPLLKTRYKSFLKTRWVFLVLLVMTTISWSTGMVGASHRDSTLNIVFVIFSTLLGVMLPLLRIRTEDQVREQMRRGLFTGLFESNTSESVTSLDRPDSEERLTTTAFERRRCKQQLYDFQQNAEHASSEITWHQ